MIEIKNVSVSFGVTKVLCDYSLTLPDTGVFCLSSPSGTGKTTLLRVILGLQQCDEGCVSGTAEKKFSVVFQDDRLLSTKSALKNVAVVSDERTAKKYLSEFGFTGEDMQKKPAQLSGGMSRRVALARALAYGGEALVMDEPFKGLDVELKGKIISTVKSSGFSLIIFTTHDTAEAEMMGAKIIAL